jgi:hypothetical protein
VSTIPKALATEIGTTSLADAVTTVRYLRQQRADYERLLSALGLGIDIDVDVVISRLAQERQAHAASDAAWATLDRRNVDAVASALNCDRELAPSVPAAIQIFQERVIAAQNEMIFVRNTLQQTLEAQTSVMEAMAARAPANADPALTVPANAIALPDSIWRKLETMQDGSVFVSTYAMPNASSGAPLVLVVAQSTTGVHTSLVSAGGMTVVEKDGNARIRARVG